jgi:hypothetical protein
MKIKKSTAKNQCPVHDEDCAPPVHCELEKGHAGEHQWSATRVSHTLQDDGKTLEKEAPVLKKFSIPVPAAPPVVKPPAPPTEKSKRVDAVLAANQETATQPN